MPFVGTYENGNGRKATAVRLGNKNNEMVETSLNVPGAGNTNEQNSLYLLRNLSVTVAVSKSMQTADLKFHYDKIVTWLPAKLTHTVLCNGHKTDAVGPMIMMTNNTF